MRARPVFRRSRSACRRLASPTSAGARPHRSNPSQVIVLLSVFDFATMPASPRARNRQYRMSDPANRETVERIELAPNCSLTVRAAAAFFGTLAFVTLAVALLFVVQGYWPVLPFAGLELPGLFLGLAA